MEALRRVATLTIASFVALASGCSARPGDVLARSRIPLVECEVPGLARTARCGTYLVRENRAATAGRQIALNLVVVPAVRGARSDDPVFYLAGGPGGSAIDAAGPTVRLLRRVNERRDLVFVDLRGTGRSNPLHCERLGPDAPLQRYFDEFLPDDYVRRCAHAQTADVRLYTEPFAIDDLDDIREALGYRRINLFGTSGGTRAAQIYMRRHPGSIRGVIMHGVHPLDGRMPLAYSQALEGALQTLIDEHPHLADAWEGSMRRFDGVDVQIVLEHPRTRASERVRLPREVYVEGMRHLLYDRAGAHGVAEVIAAAARGDFGPFAVKHIGRRRAVDAAIATGSFLSVTCAEDVAFISEEDIRRDTAGTALGDYRVRRQQAACRLWPRGQGIDDDFLRPVESDVPVLLISGDADVATPAASAERVARSLPNSRHVVFPGQGHQLSNPDCAARLIDDFLKGASPDRLDTSCVSGR